MNRTEKQIWSVLALGSLLALAPLAAQEQRSAKNKERKRAEAAENAASLPTAIWRDAGDPSALNLYYGSGGKEHAPDPSGTYMFSKEDLDGTSPKFDVEDAHGVKWRVKLGEEPQSETAATRLIWAAGYFVDDDYYLPEVKVEGLPKLKRGDEFVGLDGTVHRARLERRPKDEKKLENWDWFHNPYDGTRELNGLKVMMAFVNNWDLKAENNEVREHDGVREFVVSDIGATFGKTGDAMTRSKSDPKGYADSKFIQRAEPDTVDFVMHSRPIIFGIFNLENYKARTRMESIPRHIPREDARWLGQRLSALSSAQIRDSFEAAGYTAEEVDELSAQVKKRIGELNSL